MYEQQFHFLEEVRTLEPELTLFASSMMEQKKTYHQWIRLYVYSIEHKIENKTPSFNQVET